MIGIKNLRHKLQLNQRELAERLNVSLQTVRNWEHGRREPSIQKLIKLSEISNMTIDEIIKQEKMEYCFTCGQKIKY